MPRGISTKISRQFGLGYADANWQSLYNNIVSKKYSNQDVSDSGLFRKNKDNHWYDL